MSPYQVAGARFNRPRVAVWRAVPDVVFVWVMQTVTVGQASRC